MEKTGSLEARPLSLIPYLRAQTGRSASSSGRSQPDKIFFEPYLQAFCAFFALVPLDWAVLAAILELRRELSHRELPDGKLPVPAIIASFGVAAHWSRHNPSVSEGESW
jgi:hypothetical protein